MAPYLGQILLECGDRAPPPSYRYARRRTEGNSVDGVLALRHGVVRVQAPPARGCLLLVVFSPDVLPCEAQTIAERPAATKLPVSLRFLAGMKFVPYDAESLSELPGPDNREPKEGRARLDQPEDSSHGTL